MFDRIYAGVLAKIKEAGGVKALLYSWGFRRKAYFLGQGARYNEVGGGSVLWDFNVALYPELFGQRCSKSLGCWAPSCLRKRSCGNNIRYSPGRELGMPVAMPT